FPETQAQSAQTPIQAKPSLATPDVHTIVQKFPLSWGNLVNVNIIGENYSFIFEATDGTIRSAIFRLFDEKDSLGHPTGRMNLSGQRAQENYHVVVFNRTK